MADRFLLIKLHEPHGLYFHFQNQICLSLSEALWDEEYFSMRLSLSE
jgi:hypothetical protein